MDVIKEKGKKNLITKTWERCKSIGRGGKHHQHQGTSSAAAHGLTRKSRSWHAANAPPPDEDAAGRHHSKCKVAPEGCFSVYVGPQKQKFVVKTEYANHPLFRMLLEEAEAEYGYSSGGPIKLPCDVEIFYRVLMEMDDPDGGIGGRRQLGCGFAKGYGGYRLLSPSRMIMINQF